MGHTQQWPARLPACPPARLPARPPACSIVVPALCCARPSCRYSQESLRQRGVDALKPADRAAAQARHPSTQQLARSGPLPARSTPLPPAFFISTLRLPSTLSPPACHVPTWLQLLLTACQQGAELDGLLAPLERTITGDVRKATKQAVYICCCTFCSPAVNACSMRLLPARYACLQLSSIESEAVPRPSCRHQALLQHAAPQPDIAACTLAAHTPHHTNYS